MFRMRFAHAAGLIGDVAAIRVDAVTQSAAFLLEKVVFAADENAFVKFVIAFEKRLEFLVIDALSGNAMNLMELLSLLQTHAARRQPGTQALQFRHDLKHLDQFDQRQLLDDSAVMPPHLDEAARREGPQSFAYRRTG